jgi:elongation factor Ts
MAITASLVKELRERTGAGMMDCKKALTETDGDLDKAIEYLQIKGIAKAAKKESRVAAEGLVGTSIAADAKRAGIVEINCETDFVARNEEFNAFVDAVASKVVTDGNADVEALLASDLDGKPLDEVRKAKIASIGENITLRRAAFVSVDGEGLIGAYVHGGGSIGVLVQLSSDVALDPNGDAADLAKDVSMHVAAVNPRFVRVEQVDAETLEAERHILTEQALESGKPREIVDKMIAGRLQKWKKEICLLEQPFVKNPELTVAQEIQRVGKALGAKLDVTTFVRFGRGEGIEKAESDFAAEVASMQG